MYEHNALGYRSGLALCLTKVRSSRARCLATALIRPYIWLPPPNIVHVACKQKHVSTDAFYTYFTHN